MTDGLNTKSVQIASCYPYVTGLISFTLRDVPSGTSPPSSWNFHFGLARTDFTPKPAFSAVAAKYASLSQARATDRILACAATTGAGIVGGVTQPQPPGGDEAPISPSDWGPISPGGEAAPGATPPPGSGSATAPSGRKPVTRKKCQGKKHRSALASKRTGCKKRRH